MVTLPVITIFNKTSENRKEQYVLLGGLYLFVGFGGSTKAYFRNWQSFFGTLKNALSVNGGALSFTKDEVIIFNGGKKLPKPVHYRY